MTTNPSNPTSKPTEPVAAESSAPEADLAGAVDDLLAGIDAAGASLMADLQADAPAPAEDFAASEPSEVAPKAADESPSEHLSAHVEAAHSDEPAAADPIADAPPSHEELLNQVDALLKQAHSTPESEPATEPQTTPAPQQAPVAAFAQTDPPAAAEATEPQPSHPEEAKIEATAPKPTEIAADPNNQSIRALDEEFCLLADRLLHESQAQAADAPPPPPSSAAPRPSAPAKVEPVAPAPQLTFEPPTKVREPLLPKLTLAASAFGAKLRPLLVTVLTPISAPLAQKPAAVRHSIGWIACGTVFFATVLWAVVLTRKPATIQHEDGSYDFVDGSPPSLPVAMTEEHAPEGEAAASGEHGEAPAGKSESSSGHGEASSGHGSSTKPTAHSTSKPKSSAKKPPRKNRVAAQHKEAAGSEEHH